MDECNLEHPKVQNKPTLLSVGKTQELFDENYLSYYAQENKKYRINFLLSLRVPALLVGGLIINNFYF